MSLDSQFADREPRFPNPETSPVNYASQVLGPAPGRPVPVATFVMIVACVVVFILQTLAGGSKNTDVLMDFGASYRPYFVHGQYWRAVMPMFLHIGWWHLLWNMYALYLLGPLLERIYGYGRFVFIYVAAGIAGSLLSMLHGHAVAAGASGAIMGVAGAIPAAGYVYRDRLPFDLARIFRRGRFTFVLLGFVALTLVSGYFVSNVDNWGHLGGLAAGALLAILIRPPRLVSTASAPSEFGVSPPAAPMWRPEADSSQAIVWIPVAVVALAMLATASHYRAARQVNRWLAEGERFQRAGKPLEAFDRYQRAERANPRDERPHEALGALGLQRHEFAAAIDEFHDALRLNPDSIEAGAGLAAAYQQSGDPAKARETFESMANKNPRDVEVQEALADFFAGEKLYEPAIGRYQEVLRLSPDLALAHNNLAWLYATADDPKLRNPPAALDHARKAVALTGWRQPDFIDTLAEALYANGNYEEAVKTQMRALGLAPNNRELQEHMARYQKAAGG